jgi:molecular chaperone IbpA
MNQLARFDTTALNRALIGFDRLFNDAERGYANSIQTNYPPYNILKTSDDDYTIEVAVTGFKKDEITVEVAQGQLIIKGTRIPPSTELDVEYLHRGLAARDFERRFTMADHMEVGDAEVAEGLLRVYIKRIVPEALKPRLITIK